MSNLSEFFEGIESRVQANERWKTATLSTRQVVDQNYTPEDFEKLVSALLERPLNGDAAFRLSSFIEEKQQSRIPQPLRAKAADNLADCVNDADRFAASDVVLIFALWGDHRPEYYDVCLSLLRHPHETTRWTALRCAPVFLKSKDFSKLFEFRNDPAITEIAMGGPLRHHLRDQALEILEKLTKCPRSDGDCFETTAEGKISYRSWSLFLNWWDKHKREFQQ